MEQGIVCRAHCPAQPGLPRAATVPSVSRQISGNLNKVVRIHAACSRGSPGSILYRYCGRLRYTFPLSGGGYWGAGLVRAACHLRLAMNQMPEGESAGSRYLYPPNDPIRSKNHVADKASAAPAVRTILPMK